MLESLSALALVSFMAMSSFMGGEPKIVSPLPEKKIVNTPTPTPLPPTSTPVPPTATPIPPTPTPIPPTPTIVPIVVSSTDLENMFTKYSGEYAVDGQLLRSIARCESGFNPNAENGEYRGMFQFSSQSWATARVLMNADPAPDLRTNAEESIKTAAFKLSRGEQRAWSGCL